MGLFRSRARKNREMAAPEPRTERTSTVTAPAEASTVTAPAEASIVTPPDASIVTPPVDARAVTAPAEAARREVTAETRPDPDQPGWGRSLGQAIGKPREDRATRD